MKKIFLYGPLGAFVDILAERCIPKVGPLQDQQSLSLCILPFQIESLCSRSCWPGRGIFINQTTKYLKKIIYRSKEYLIYLLFFLPYTGTGIPAYIICLLWLLGYLILQPHRVSFDFWDIIFLFIISIWFGLKLQQSSVIASVILLRYYFGFFIFYFFFRISKIKIDLNKLLFYISIAVILEAVAVNTIIRPEQLPNFPGNNPLLSFKTSVLGFYQRPYSIGTNASISSTLLMVMLFYLKHLQVAEGIKISRRTIWSTICAVILLASGEGYLLFLLYLVYLFKPYKNILRAIISTLVIIFIYSLIFIWDVGSLNGLNKISSTYIEFLYNFKTDQIIDVYRQLLRSSLLIGDKFVSPSELIIWSDFAWNDLLLCTGIIGLMLILIISIIKMNKSNRIPLLIFLLGAFHYGAMYSLPGQLLVGYFFALGFKTKAEGQGTINRF